MPGSSPGMTIVGTLADYIADTRHSPIVIAGPDLTIQSCRRQCRRPSTLDARVEPGHDNCGNACGLTSLTLSTLPLSSPDLIRRSRVAVRDVGDLQLWMPGSSPGMTIVGTRASGVTIASGVATALTFHDRGGRYSPRARPQRSARCYRDPLISLSVRRMVSASGSIGSSMIAGLPDAMARSSAGRNSSVVRTVSPCPPKARA